MRIIVLGGAGDMGSRAVEDLAVTEGVREVTIADRNVSAAERLAARIRGKGAAVNIRRVDANDHVDLVQAMRGHDAAASTLGPFHRFEAKLVRAAIEAGVDYASVCDEWEAAEAVFDQFAEQARTRGRIILTGLGTSPGMTNIAARYLSQPLDKLRRVDVCVLQPLNAGGGEAVIRHMLFIISGSIAVWRKKGRAMVPACGEDQMIDFPRFGRMKVWNMGHSEPLTIPRFFPDIEEVNFFMGFGRGSSCFIRPAQWGWWKNQRLADVVVRIVAALERMTGQQAPATGAVRIDVWGEKDGQNVHRMVCGVGQMREATGLSLSIGTVMLARRELLTQVSGVYAPEGCIDPRTFIQRLQAKGVSAYEDLAMTTPIGT